ncbi:MAG: antibiotic biosynthesis monooxygenase [Actinomycetota bacterium]|nr:antibiotic biosynthesis monooxygenase [Actinomycetota bacterium]
MSELQGDSSAPILLVINRFRVASDQSASFAEDARLALATLAGSVGFIDGAIAQATDETDLRLVTTRWKDVGSYRRALSRFEVKVSAVPLLSQAIDESSAFEAVHMISDGETITVASGRAADADVIGLGRASAARVPPVQL